MARRGLLEVEEVASKPALRRFLELPFALHHRDPRWAPPVAAFERWRLDPARNPFFEGGDAAYFLLRRGGHLAGRITAHVAAREPGAHEDRGAFGFFAVDDDEDAARALVDAAREWLRERGCTSMAGPLSFTAAIEAGVLAEGFDVEGVTGRPWHPPWYAAHLVACGLGPAGDLPAWRFPAVAGDPDDPDEEVEPDRSAPAPPHAGAYADRALVLTGIAAVPDLAGPLRHAGMRAAWSLAKRAKARSWDGCTVVRLDGDPAVLVPRLVRAAGAAGYSWIVAPWSPDPSAPTTVHRLFQCPL